MPEVKFVNEKTKKEYKVVQFDPVAGKVTLVGEHGVEFTEPFDKALFKQLGYRLVQAEATA
jgi:hypothetical protein